MSAVIWVYALLLRLYPHRFQAEFGEEMEAVFAASVDEAAQGGPARLAATCLRELFDLPSNVLREHFQRSHHPTGGFPMSTTTCRHCGYAGPDDARYCAHLSYALLSLIMAVGSFMIGWRWDERLPNHRLVYRALTMAAIVLILLVSVLTADRFIMSRPQGNEQTFVVDIPGIHSEATVRRVAGEECCAMHATRVVYYSWPYVGLIIYTLLFAVVGNLLKRKFPPPHFAGGSAA